MAKNKNRKQINSDTEFAQEVTAKNAKQRQRVAQSNANQNACGFADENQNV